jgi:hypothetical protein
VLFIAVANNETLAVCPRRDQVEDILEKAAGDRKTKFKTPAIADLINHMDLKQSIQTAATQDMITGSLIRLMFHDGKTTSTVKLSRLGDAGIERLMGRGSITDKLSGKATLILKDSESARRLAEATEQVLAQEKQRGARASTNQEELAALMDLNSIKVSVKERVVIIEGHAGAEAVQAVFKGMGLALQARRPDR